MFVTSPSFIGHSCIVLKARQPCAKTQSGSFLLLCRPNYLIVGDSDATTLSGSCFLCRVFIRLESLLLTNKRKKNTKLLWLWISLISLSVFLQLHLLKVLWYLLPWRNAKYRSRCVWGNELLGGGLNTSSALFYFVLHCSRKLESPSSHWVRGGTGHKSITGHTRSLTRSVFWASSQPPSVWNVAGNWRPWRIPAPTAGIMPGMSYEAPALTTVPLWSPRIASILKTYITHRFWAYSDK